MSETNYKFVKDGVNVRIKREVQDVILTPRDLICDLKNLRDGIMKDYNTLNQLQQQKEDTQFNIDVKEKRLKNIEKFEDSALLIQRSKAKMLYDELKEDCMETVISNKKEDPTLTEAQDLNQMYMQFQKALGTHPEVNKSLAPVIIQDCYFNECIFKNPFNSKNMHKTKKKPLEPEEEGK